MADGGFTAVRLVGGLLTGDLLDRIRAGDSDLPGSRPEDYHLAPGERLGEAASRRWEYLLGVYRTFRERLERLPRTDPGTTETRRWLLTLLSELGYGQQVPYIRAGIKAGDRHFPVSHLWQHVPMHLLGWHMELDRPSGRGETGRAPQSMLQDCLNASDSHLWGVLSNGKLLRLIRDSTQLTGSSYVEFDLEAIFDGEIYPDFVLLYALLHSSRLELPEPSEEGAEPNVLNCRIEQWRRYAAETGMRARDLLRDQVKQALEELGTGFLADPANGRLCDWLAKGGNQERDDFRHELLRLVYQLIFLFVSEDRGVLLDRDADDAAHARYATYFSTARLRRIAARRHGDRHGDLWRTLVIVLDALGTDGGRPELALPELGGLYFRGGAPDGDDGPRGDLLRDCVLSNERLLTAVRLLSEVRDRRGRRHRIDYRHLGAEELGSVYESLLEYEPRPDPAARSFRLEELPGNKRKTTGSYYTPTPLIEKLLDTTLDPIIDEYEASGRVPDDLLKITVCDPACGSGHFLVAAARRIAKRYAVMDTGDLEPPPEKVESALAKVVRHCIYGVDINPLAAELAKVSLWLASVRPGEPLAFLDAHIRVGNSLLGVTPKLLKGNIPDDAFKPLEGDDRKIVTGLKKQNADQRGSGLGEGQIGLFAEQEGADRVGNREFGERSRDIAERRGSSLADVRTQARLYEELLDDRDRSRKKRVADAWCAAFVWPRYEGAPKAITSKTLDDLAAGTEPPADVAAELSDLIETYAFFHWYLEFPDIFRTDDEEAPDADPDNGWQGGFSCVVGNPPWERVKLQEQEFFASSAPKIAGARNAAARGKLIEALATSEHPEEQALYEEFNQAKRKAGGVSHLLRESGRYPKTGKGDINTYSVFAETARTIIAPTGRAGMVLPTGIATDATTASFFGDLVRSGKLGGFLEFENEEFLLSRSVHHSFRFCLLSIAGRRAEVSEAVLAFGARQMSDVEARAFVLPPEDILLLNPNTGTLPLFRSPRDARIALDIYRAVPVLWKELPNRNPWGLSFMAMLHMANDSGSFAVWEDLQNEGWRLEGNICVRDEEQMLPLYEAKMISHFDHRYGTYAGQTQAQANMGTLPRLMAEQHADPDHVVLPRYWVKESEVDERLNRRAWDRGWLLGWRDIARSSDERTLIPALLPRVAAPDTALLAFPGSGPAAGFLANLSAFVVDYVTRQKSAGTHLKYFTFKQLPVLPPGKYTEVAPWGSSDSLAEWIESRTMELVYTAWDIKAFAEDHGDEGPPFVWDEERRFWTRAELDAAYFRLYGVRRDDVDYIMDSFRAFRNNDPERFARTKAAILDCFDAMENAERTGEPYKTVLDPPPGQGPRHPTPGDRQGGNW